MGKATQKTANTDKRILSKKYLEKEFDSIDALCDDISGTDFEVLGCDSDSRRFLIHIWSKKREVINGWSYFMMDIVMDVSGKVTVTAID